MNRFCLIFFCLSLLGKAQLEFRDRNTDLGAIKEASEIKGDVIVSNVSGKKIYLLRADADQGVKVYTSKKTLLSGDTCLLVISFIPESKGRFKRVIHLVSNAQSAPDELSLAGSIQNLKTNDKTACYYFGSRRNNAVSVKDQALVVTEPTEKRAVSNRIPDPSIPSPPLKTEKPKAPEEQPKETSAGELSPLLYRPNNILFLVDVSGSMKDSLKLPLMKSALHTLIDAVREVDYITFVTYADSVKIVSEAVKGSDKQHLHNLVNGLRAKGLTKGNKAILFSQQLAQKHFIAEGNNQIFLATDGKFRFYNDDFKAWSSRQGDKKIILSTVAFGNDKDAMNTLKEIADQCEGSFIHIRKRGGSHDKLLEEVKLRSKR